MPWRLVAHSPVVSAPEQPGQADQVGASIRNTGPGQSEVPLTCSLHSRQTGQTHQRVDRVVLDDQKHVVVEIAARHTLCVSLYDMSANWRAADLSDEDYANLAQTRRLLRRYLAFSEHAAEAAGLEPQHYQLLLMLRGVTPGSAASISDLADWLQIRHHSAVGLVDRMQARGLVERHADPVDARRVLVAPTPLGRSALRGLAVLHRDELLRLAPGLVDRLQQLIDSPPTGPAPELESVTSA